MWRLKKNPHASAGSNLYPGCVRGKSELRVECIFSVDSVIKEHVAITSADTQVLSVTLPAQQNLPGNDTLKHCGRLEAIETKITGVRDVFRAGTNFMYCKVTQPRPKQKTAVCVAG